MRSINEKSIESERKGLPGVNVIEHGQWQGNHESVNLIRFKYWDTDFTREKVHCNFHNFLKSNYQQIKHMPNELLLINEGQ